MLSLGGRRRRNSTVGRVFPQSNMSPVFVVIANVFFQQSSEMSLVQNNHVVKQIRRTLPTQRSATPFCQGLRKAVRIGSMSLSLTDETTSAENFASRSKIKYRCGCSYPQASRSCGTIHKAFG